MSVTCDYLWSTIERRSLDAARLMPQPRFMTGTNTFLHSLSKPRKEITTRPCARHNTITNNFANHVVYCSLAKETVAVYDGMGVPDREVALDAAGTRGENEASSVITCAEVDVAGAYHQRVVTPTGNVYLACMIYISARAS